MSAAALTALARKKHDSALLRRRPFVSELAMDVEAQDPGRVGPAHAPVTRARDSNSIGDDVAGDAVDPARADEAPNEREFVDEVGAASFRTASAPPDSAGAAAAAAASVGAASVGTSAAGAGRGLDEEFNDERAALERFDDLARGPRGEMLAAGGLRTDAPSGVEASPRNPTTSLLIYVLLSLSFLVLADPLVDVLTRSNGRGWPARWLILVLQHPVRSLLALLLLSIAVRPSPHGDRSHAGPKPGTGL